MTDNEYAVQDDDLKGGGGFSAKPRGKYTIRIEKAESKTDKGKKAYLAFSGPIAKGKIKGKLFENYLPIARDVNKYQAARRNSFYKAINLKPGALPYGAPVSGAPAAELLVGTYVDVALEHRFEQVPGEEYNITSSSSPKQPWKADGWDKCVNEKGQLYKNPGGDIFDAPVDPKEELTFYEVSDEFEGVGDPDAQGEPEAAEEEWG